MKRSTSQRDASEKFRIVDAEAPSTLLQSLAARVWHDVTDGAGVVHARHLSKPPQELTEANFKGIASAEAARLQRHARLKKEAAEAKKKGGARCPPCFTSHRSLWAFAWLCGASLPCQSRPRPSGYSSEQSRG